MLLNDLAALGNRLPHDASHTLARVLGLQHVWPMFCETCDTPDPWALPVHRTEAGYPRCATCDGGGCPDCTDLG